ncbi:hypothetical protein WJX77_007935 [Trebouxia sp. C0004]
MGKRKGTSAAKKRDKREQRQKDIRAGHVEVNLKKEYCNSEMVCDSCQNKQKNRAFCYFCSAVQRLPQCAECGRTKCMMADCTVPHVGKSATGMNLVGAVCDYCEAWICHSKKCLQTHACRCPVADAMCVECERGVWQHGGRMFKCASCDNWICEDDQFEHQASCQVLESESNHCISCNRLGVWSCLRCKIAFCDTHVKGKVNQVLAKNQAYKCKKCGYELQESKMLSLSTRQHDYGRQSRDDAQGYYSAFRGAGHEGDTSEGEAAGSAYGVGAQSGLGMFDRMNLGDDISEGDEDEEDSEEESSDEE